MAAHIDADGPGASRATVRFRNWDVPGMVIQGTKLREDAAFLRGVAAHLQSIKGEAAQRDARALETMAGQYEQASRGESSQAR